MKEPTPKQIIAEIAELKRIKPLIPMRNGFGDNNHERIAAQICVLEQRLSEDDIHELSKDEEDEDSMWRNQDNVSLGCHAARWMDGEEREAPSSGWQSLVGVKAVQRLPPPEVLFKSPKRYVFQPRKKK